MRDMVAFRKMSDGTQADYDLLDRRERAFFAAHLPDQILAALDRLRAVDTGFQVNRLDHSLQSATRAMRDGADEEYVVAALIHDIGDEL